MGFKSNQKVASYSYDIHATITPVDTFCQAIRYYSSQSSELDKTVDYYSPSVAPSNMMKASQIGGKLQAGSIRFLHSLWLNYMTCLGIEFYHQVLKGN